MPAAVVTFKNKDLRSLNGFVTERKCDWVSPNWRRWQGIYCNTSKPTLKNLALVTRLTNGAGYLSHYFQPIHGKLTISGNSP